MTHRGWHNQQSQRNYLQRGYNARERFLWNQQQLVLPGWPNLQVSEYQVDRRGGLVGPRINVGGLDFFVPGVQ